MKRTDQLKVLLSLEEKKWLDAIAERRGLTASDVIRQFIRSEYAALEIRDLHKRIDAKLKGGKAG
jgi:hypothetical protein